MQSLTRSRHGRSWSRNHWCAVNSGDRHGLPDENSDGSPRPTCDEVAVGAAAAATSWLMAAHRTAADETRQEMYRDIYASYPGRGKVLGPSHERNVAEWYLWSPSAETALYRKPGLSCWRRLSPPRPSRCRKPSGMQERPCRCCLQTEAPGRHCPRGCCRAARIWFKKRRRSWLAP